MTDRIDEIINLVDENKIVCDVGTDHGITAIRIFLEKNPKKVIATDISSNSLQKIIDKIEKYNYDITTVVTDGIVELGKFQPDQIIISGMGGYLISRIIEEGMEVARSAEKLILQANNSLHHLRKFLLSNGFEITKEVISFEEDIYYDIIQASFSGGQIEMYQHDYEYEYGKLNIESKNPMLLEKLKREEQNSIELIEKLKFIGTESSKKRIYELELVISHIGDIYKCI